VDLSQRGAGREAVSSSVAHVYIGSSPVDSARLIVTHGTRLRAAIDSLSLQPREKLFREVDEERKVNRALPAGSKKKKRDPWLPETTLILPLISTR
jgi:hypothetical protein